MRRGLSIPLFAACALALVAVVTATAAIITMIPSLLIPSFTFQRTKVTIFSVFTAETGQKC